MPLRSGPGHPYEALWIVECDKCGEVRLAWAQGHQGQYFRLNPTLHPCHADIQHHDDAPRSWFSVVLADGTYTREERAIR